MSIPTSVSIGDLVPLAARWVCAVDAHDGQAHAWLQALVDGDRLTAGAIRNELWNRTFRWDTTYAALLLRLVEAAEAGDRDDAAGWLLCLARQTTARGLCATAAALLATVDEPDDGVFEVVAGLLEASDLLETDRRPA